MSCDVGEVTERLENEQSSWIDKIYMFAQMIEESLTYSSVAGTPSVYVSTIGNAVHCQIQRTCSCNGSGFHPATPCMKGQGFTCRQNNQTYKLYTPFSFFCYEIKYMTPNI